MDTCNATFAILTVFVLVSLTNFSSSFPSCSKTDDFKAIFCKVDTECQEVCFSGGPLYSRCDTNGTCICDCSDSTFAPSSYPEQCGMKQPDGCWRDYCDTYCNQEYLRPFRYCKNSDSKCYCTCVCAR